MNKNRLYIFTLAAAMMLTACEGKQHKQLISGIETASEIINEAGKIINEDDVTSLTGTAETPDKGGNEGAEADKGLEIPAPLHKVPEQILYRTGYTTSYNKDTKLPNWVAWCLTAEHTEGPNKRPHKAFHEDTDVPEPRAVDWDYYNSGYDRGHMCPAADNKWSGEAMYESFLFTNMCPQNHILNVGDWNEMENQCRQWAKEYGELYIICGPLLLNQKHKTIGDNKVVVPEAFFKVVLRMRPTPKAIGFIYRNTEGNRPKDAYLNSVDEVERITGMDFFPALPDDIENKIEKERDFFNEE